MPDSLHYRLPWRLTDNRVLLELIELGIETGKQKEQAFFELAERFRASDDPAEAKQLGGKLGRMAFGEWSENFEPFLSIPRSQDPCPADAGKPVARRLSARLKPCPFTKPNGRVKISARLKPGHFTKAE